MERETHTETWKQRVIKTEGDKKSERDREVGKWGEQGQGLRDTKKEMEKRDRDGNKEREDKSGGEREKREEREKKQRREREGTRMVECRREEKGLGRE